ncbi:MAG: cupin domain-containing protein [Alphaproteobacteria bacterium]
MADIDPTTPLTRDPSEAEMEARIARFSKLVPYKETMNTAHGIPAEAMRMMSTEKVFPVMSPHDWTGRSSIAPVKGAPGLTISIAETPPGDNPGLHIHTKATENFFCLKGRFRIEWGPNAEYSTILEENDFISVPPGIYRNFVNLTDDTARLLAIIQTPPGDTEDEVVMPPSVRRELAETYGDETLAKMNELGFRFAAE